MYWTQYNSIGDAKILLEDTVHVIQGAEWVGLIVDSTTKA